MTPKKAIGHPPYGTQRSWHLRRLLFPLLLTLVCGGICLSAAGYALGKVDLSDWQLFFFGAGSVVFGIGMAAGPFLLVRRTIALFTWKKRLADSTQVYLDRDHQRYAPDPEQKPAASPLEVLTAAFSCPPEKLPALYGGQDWILAPGSAMKRDAVVGAYFSEESWLSRPRRDRTKYTMGDTLFAEFTRCTPAWRTRFLLVDEDGRRLWWELPPKDADRLYLQLLLILPQADRGDLGKLEAFRRREGKHPDYRKLRRPMGPTPYGLSRWDQSPILEENPIATDTERWLLAACAPYLMEINLFGAEDIFSRAGGQEYTAIRHVTAYFLLSQRFRIQDREELLVTVQTLLAEGTARREAWRLRRAVILLDSGYFAGLLTRRELLEQFLPVGQAIQETFSSWEDYHEAFFTEDDKRPRETPEAKLSKQRTYYETLREDPASILHTVPFRLELSPDLPPAEENITG